MRLLLHKMSFITYLEGEMGKEVSWLREDECRLGVIKMGVKNERSVGTGHSFIWVLTISQPAAHPCFIRQIIGSNWPISSLCSICTSYCSSLFVFVRT